MKLPRFVAGFVAGAAALCGLAALVNSTDRADVLVAPLLVHDSSANADAIVVPGAGVLGPRCEPNLAALRRTLLAVRLWKERRAPLVVFTGGAPAEHGNCAVGGVMGDLAVQLGLPREALLVEDRSHNTHENAVLTKALLAPRGVNHVLVVTDALHVRRASACFRREGFAVEPVSVQAMLAYGSNVGMLRMGVHEALALAWYRLRGYI